MNDKIYLTRQDDTLRYRVIAQRTLAQDTVCVSVHVALLVSALTLPGTDPLLLTKADPPSVSQ